MYEIVNKCGDVCEVLDTSDGVVTSCSVTDLCNLFLNGVFVQGFNYDINQGVFHIDFDDSNYKQSVKNRVERDIRLIRVILTIRCWIIIVF